LRRCRLACVSRAFQAFCEQHATKRKRQHTEVLVPMKKWEAYADGVSRWLAWHSTALRAVRVQFEVRSWLSQVALARKAHQSWLLSILLLDSRLCNTWRRLHSSKNQRQRRSDRAQHCHCFEYPSMLCADTTHPAFCCYLTTAKNDANPLRRGTTTSSCSCPPRTRRHSGRPSPATRRRSSKSGWWQMGATCR